MDYLSTGDRDGAVCVWDLATQQKAHTFDMGVYAVAFDPTGRYLAGAGLDGQGVRLGPDHRGTGVRAGRAPGARSTRSRSARTGATSLSGGDDLTVRVWDVLSGRLLVAREFDSPVQAVAFSPDGAYLFTGNGNTTCYQVEFKKLLEE